MGALVASLLAPSSAFASTYSWSKGGQSGGGYANAIAVDPRGGSAVVAGDVWGFAATTDSGSDWYPTNLGESGTSNRPYGRTVAYSLKYPGRAYVGVGTLKYASGTGGGYLAQIDESDPYRLQKVNTSVSFTSYLPTGGAGDLPRPVGNLIAVDYDQTTGIEYLYLLTRQGLMRSTDGGQTLTPLGLQPPSPLFAWSDINIQHNGDLLVSTFRTSDTAGSILYRVKNPRGVPTISRITKAPPVIEDIANVRWAGHNRTFIAAGAGGVVTFGGAVKLPGAGLHISSVVQGSDGTIWVGNGIGSSTHKNIAKSTDGGAHWTWVTSPGNVSQTIMGTSRTWWLSNAWSNLAKGSGYSVSQLAVDPVDPSIVYSAGRSGMWQTRDGGATWHPAVNGQDGSESNRLVLGATGEVWATDTDYKASYTTDHFVNATQTNTIPALPAQSLSRTMTDGTTVQVVTGNDPKVLVNGVDVTNDFAKSAMLNPKDLAVDVDGTIYIALSGGVLVGKPTS